TRSALLIVLLVLRAGRLGQSISCHFSELAASDITERQRRPQRNACARIIAAHDALGVVAHGVKPRNRVSLSVEHTSSAIGTQAGKGSDIANDKPDGIVRGMLQRCHARVGLMQRVALITVVGLATLAK